MKNRESFTLIEMLIVIVIIGILAAALVPRLTSVQSRARDTKRKTDFRNIYNAETIFKLDNGRYAQTWAAIFYSYNVSTWLAELSGVMSSIPVDPINNTTNNRTTGGYNYYYSNYDGVGVATSYQLNTQLENTKDPDRCEIKEYLYPHSSYVNGLPRCPQVALPATRYQYLFDPLNLSKHQ